MLKKSSRENHTKATGRPEVIAYLPFELMFQQAKAARQTTEMSLSTKYRAFSFTNANVKLAAAFGTPSHSDGWQTTSLRLVELMAA